jgi:hypothetical protein
MLFCGFIRNGEFRVGMILYSNFIFRFYNNLADSTLLAFGLGGAPPWNIDGWILQPTLVSSLPRAFSVDEAKIK